MSPSAEPASRALLPTDRAERIDAIDIIRGIALFGVLTMNLLIDFRVPLMLHGMHFHTDPGTLNHLVDWFFELFVGGKAFTTFSFLFGVGLAIQAERAEARGRGVKRFLARRFLVLLGLGLFHMFALWNGDILTLYAVTGLICIVFVRRRPTTILVTALVLGVLVSLPMRHASSGGGKEDMQRSIEEALHAYGSGTFLEVAAYRVKEAIHQMVWIYVSLLPRTLGMFLVGIFAHRKGILRRPADHRTLLLSTAAIGLPVGLGATIAISLVRLGEIHVGRWLHPIVALSMVPFALGYIACLLLLLERPAVKRWLGYFAPIGRMALTNYLCQSIVLGFVFYGYGLGLFGKIGPAAAAPIGLALYAIQIAFSVAWLRRYRFGPVEWLWRSLTYGARQPMRIAR